MDISITDIAYEVRDLYAPTDSESLPYVGLEHIQPDSLHLSGLGNSSDTQSTKKKFRSGDILFGTLRPYFRKVVRAKFDGVCSTDITVVRTKEPIDTGFLFYLIASHSFIDYATTTSSGTRMPRAKWSLLSQMDWGIPEQEKRVKIASVLSAYDDLIENNNRRIEILEEMTRIIYREWFVEFRFPGHEQVPMVESELGLIPQDWEVKSFGEVSLNFDRQRKPLSGMVRSTMQGEYPYYGAAKILDHINGYLFDGRYLLIAEDGSVITEDGKPVLQLVNGKFWVNNHAHVVQGKVPISTNFLYLFMSNVAISGYITGSAQPKINQDNLNRIPILSPPQGLLEGFSKVIEPIFDNVVALDLKNTSLRQTRDLLLPKLISGELDISDLEIDTNKIQPKKGGKHIPDPLKDQLHSDENILGGKPVIKGTRLAAAFILELLERGWSEEEVLDNYPDIGREDIAACLAYQQKVTDASVSG